METIRARKAHSLSGQDPSSTEEFFNHPGKLHNPSSLNDPSSSSSSKIEFRYCNDLLLSLFLPVGILLAFGGKFSIVTVGFGFLITYIFDLLGTMEGTYMTLILTTFILWISLVWAARLLLVESRWNVSLVLTMGILLFLTVITMSSQFRNLLKEFSGLFYFLETFIFAVLPLVASMIVTWFLCVEVPMLDVSFCFSLVYFCYMVYLGRPRVSSYPYSGSYAKDLKFRHTCFVLNGPLVKVMNSVPLVISPLLAVAVKANSLLSIRLVDLAFSFLFPLFLMLVTFDLELDYFPPDERKFMNLDLSSAKVLVAAMLFACIQGHPIFADLKAFSTLSDPLASAALCGAVMLAIVGVGIYRSENVRDPDEDFTEQRQSTMSLIKRVMVDVCMGAAGLLGGVLLRLPWSALPIAVVFPVSLAEYYQRTSGKPDAESRVTNVLIACLAAVSAAAIALCYCMETVFFYSFEFHWDAYNLGLREFSFLITVMAAFAVLSPMFLYDKSKSEATHLRLGRDVDSFLPTAMYDGFKGIPGAAINPFQMFFSLGSAAVAFVELLVREQDWSNHASAAAIVYPNPVFIGTALLLCFSAAHLYSNKAIRAWCVWTVFISQALKLTHLAGVSPHDSLAIGALIRAYTFPFVCHCIGYSEEEAEEELFKDAKRGGYGVGAPLLLFYMGVAAMATYYAKERVIAQLLVLLTWKDSGDAQHWTAGLCMYCALLATLLRVFMRRLTIIRRYALISLNFYLFHSNGLCSRCIVFSSYSLWRSHYSPRRLFR